MPRLTVRYATDEDVCVHAPGDFPQLVPADQALASASDGAIAEGSWDLTSASSDFESLGVSGSDVVHLKAPRTAFGKSGHLLVVESVSGTTATLRRRNMDAGKGLPPGPSGGLASVEFDVLTLAPQIEEVSYDLNERYAIQPWLTDRTTADLTDLRQLRRLCVLGVLAMRYADMAKNGDERSDLWAFKARETRKRFDELARRCELRWGPDGDDAPPTGGRFGRASR